MTKSLVPVEQGKPVANIPSPDNTSAASFATLPQLVIDHANLPTTAKQLAAYLSQAGHLFERGTQAVRIVQGRDGERIERLNPQSVIVEAHEVCRPAEERNTQGTLVLHPVTLPVALARIYLNLGADRNLPILNGICAAPRLSDDGTIHTAQGFDRSSGLWCLAVEIPAIAPRPTADDAKGAFQFIRTCFASFPFADSARLQVNQNFAVDLSKDPGADESAFLIALMTAICRPSLPLAPALLIRAPELSGSGAGKGLLVHAIAQIAFAQKPKAFTTQGAGRELTKRIESAMMQSEPMIFLDNCNDELLDSNVLAQVLTETAVSTRPLGHSKMTLLFTNAFIVVTGNAVQISEDLARRFLVVELDPKCENPEQRRFDQDFHALISARRLELLAAFLTIWRWGRLNTPEAGLPFGSFGVWSTWCRESVAGARMCRPRAPYRGAQGSGSPAAEYH
jgi:hypothetical protein